MKLKFKYSRWLCLPTEVFPTRHSILSPVIRIAIKYQGKKFDTVALLDSGANWCIFPASVGEYLGIQIDQGKKLEYTGVSARGIAYFHNVTLEIGGWGHNCLVGFSPNLDTMNVPAVLGHNGFFDRYEVIFNYKKEIIEIKQVN